MCGSRRGSAGWRLCLSLPWTEGRTMMAAIDDAKDRTHAREERNVFATRKPVCSLYVDRHTGQWIVKDAEGNFWIVPLTDNPWRDREPFQPTEESDLEPV